MIIKSINVKRVKNLVTFEGLGLQNKEISENDGLILNTIKNVYYTTKEVLIQLYKVVRLQVTVFYGLDHCKRKVIKWS